MSSGAFFTDLYKPNSAANSSSSSPTQLSVNTNASSYPNNTDDIQKKLNRASYAKSINSFAQVAAIGMGATGIGIPISGLMAGILILTDQLIRIYENNLLLKRLMQDVMYIMSDCYLLYQLIEQSYEILTKYSFPLEKCGKSQEKEPQEKQTPKIDFVMQSQLKYQIEQLINNLMKISDTKTIISLVDAPDVNGYKHILENELTIRKNEYKFSISKASRNYSRKFNSEEQTISINNSLIIINSYTILLKSKLDFIVKNFEILSPVEYKKIWEEIICSPQYKLYIKPIFKNIMNKAEIDANNVNASDLEADISLLNKADAAAAEKTAEKTDVKNVITGGRNVITGGRNAITFKRKLFIKKKSIKNRK